MKEQIRKIIINNGSDVCGIANISRFDKVEKEYHPNTIWKDCKSIIVFGFALPKGFYDISSRLIYGHISVRLKLRIGHIDYCYPYLVVCI